VTAAPPLLLPPNREGSIVKIGLRTSSLMTFHVFIEPKVQFSEGLEPQASPELQP